MTLDNNRLIKLFSCIIAIVGILIIIGWVADIPSLRTLLLGTVEMKFLSAVSFLMSSILLYSLVKKDEIKNKESGLFVFLIVIFSSFILLIILISILNIMGLDLNIEYFINPNYIPYSKTLPVSVPSIATIFNFFLIMTISFMNLFCSSCAKKANKVFGSIIILISIIVLVGYISGVSLLTSAIPNISKAMSIPSSILFILIGISLFLLNSKNNSNSKFEVKYSIKQKLIIGSSMLISFTIILAALTSLVIYQNDINLKQIDEVEAPLQVMVEEVISYDALLTSNAEAALLHSIKKETSEAKIHKDWYDQQGIVLDNLLKNGARILLSKSKRNIEDKELVYGYLKELDRVNLALVDLELGAFAAMEKGDTTTAYNLIVGSQYQEYKQELRELYTKWYVEEKRISDIYAHKVINNLNKILIFKIILSLIIIIFGIIMSFFIIRSIVNPLSKLEKVADEISSGNLNVKVSSDTKNMPGVIGQLAIAYEQLIQSAHFALETTIFNKIRGKEEVSGSEKKYQSLYELSTDAIMTIEPPTWKFTSGNPTTIKMFKAKNEKDFVSTNPWTLSPKYQPDGQLSSVKAKKMIEKAVKNGNNFFEWIHKRKNGEEFLATVRLSYVKIDGKFVVEATVRDIKKEENILKKASLKLNKK
ncbi:MAG: hypothetical protein PHD81_03270 [Candidatus Nanoarchaeia archaeon]|nr:hypothetical protein [Candidatus Nanoarchaeia archaeon]MDD5588105.1 hypothetical protein [Candidatus Nanoarchaeia archaeon]